MNPNPHTDSMDDCDALLDLIPEYAFGLANADETHRVEANLERCPDARARLDEYRRLQEAMRESVAQIDPPQQVGARLMAAIAVPPVVAVPPAPVPAPIVTAPPAVPTPVKPRRTIRMGWWVAAAAVIALVASNVYWLTRVSDLTQSNDLLTALTSAQNGAFVLTDTTALHWVRLADAQAQGDANAFMMWNSASKTGLLYARSFPELQPGYKYHVWLTRPNERVFVGILQVDANGDGALLFSSPEPINDFAWAWVTAQSGPDNSAPSDSAIVKGELNPA